MKPKIKIIKIPVFHSERISTQMNCSYLPPLSLAVLTSYLRKRGYDVSQDDLNIKVHYNNYYFRKDGVDLERFTQKGKVLNHLKGKYDRHLLKEIKKILNKTSLSNCDITLLSVEAHFGIQPLLLALSMSKYIKQNYKKKVIIGGSDKLLSIPEMIKNRNFVDLLYIGSCCGIDKTIDSVLHGKKTPHSFYKNSYRILENKKYLDPILKPDFDGLPLDMYRWKIKPNLTKTNINEEILILPIKFISGCPNNCAFCCSSANKGVYFIKPKTVVKYLKYLSLKHNTKYFYFINDTTNISYSYMEELCNILIEEKLNLLWSACLTFKNVDSALLKKIKKAGGIRLVFGLESANQRILKYINKNINLNQISNILKSAHKNGIWIGIDLIAGIPYEREGDIHNTINFVNENSKYIDSIWCEAFYISDGSLFLKHPQEYKLKNIKEKIQFANFEGEPLNHEFIKYKFDEAVGLRWKDKKEQINKSLKKLRYGIKVREVNIPCEEPFLLFLLYSLFSNKKVIKEKYNKIKSRMQRELCLNFSFIVRNLKKVRTFPEIKKKVKSLI